MPRGCRLALRPGYRNDPASEASTFFTPTLEKRWNKSSKQELARAAWLLLAASSVPASARAGTVGVLMRSSQSNRPLPTSLGLAVAGLSAPAWALDTIVPIPEPGSMALALGAIGVAVLVWRNRRK